MAPDKTIHRQRDEDEARFEDWSRWRPWIYFYDDPKGAFFGVRIAGAPMANLVRRIKGATVWPKVRYDASHGWYRIPISSWRDLRAAAPRLEAAAEARIANLTRAT